jgi:hypothetical protein
MVWVLPATPPLSSVMISVALKVPALGGVNVTLRVQVLPAANEPPQVFPDKVKAPGLAPPKVTLAIFKGVLPVLVSVTPTGALLTVWDWLPNVILLADSPATPAFPTPVPLRVIDCGLPMALSVINTLALRLPAALGVKVTLMLQLPPGTTEPLQVLVALKSPGFAPITLTPLTVNDVLPVLLRVTDWEELVVPRF